MQGGRNSAESVIRSNYRRPRGGGMAEGFVQADGQTAGGDTSDDEDEEDLDDDDMDDDLDDKDDDNLDEQEEEGQDEVALIFP